MKILVDTDVILDVVLAREPHSDASAEVLQRLEAGRARGFVAWHTLANLYYMVDGPDRQLRNMLKDLLKFMRVPGVSSDEAMRAIELPVKDFEDALQVVSAESAGAEFIVTRNIRDYKNSPVPAKTPARWLKEA